MAEYTPHQKKIINRYYDHRDEIALTRLQEIVTEIYLAATDKKSAQLWKQAEKAMTALKVPPATVSNLLAQRDPENLAKSVRVWLSESRRPKK